MRHVAVGALFASLMTVAGSSAGAENSAADREAVAAAAARFEAAENAGSVDEFRGFFADDLVLMSPNQPPVIGGDQVAALMRAFHGAFEVQVEYHSQEIVVFGDWAFDRGTEHYVLKPKAGGDPIEKSGNYLYLYHRQADGSWKQSRVISN